jgi:ferric-dicitrate binding protein FerR (iron transport regulator)
VTLPDGSSLELGADARLRIVDLSPSAAALTLETGLLSASVAGEAEAGHWRLDAGPFIVLSGQAHFWVSWDPQFQLFEIALSEGTVSVEGPVLGESKLVESGHSLRVSVPDSLAVLTSLTDAEVPSPPEP